MMLGSGEALTAVAIVVVSSARFDLSAWPRGHRRRGSQRKPASGLVIIFATIGCLTSAGQSLRMVVIYDGIATSERAVFAQFIDIPIARVVLVSCG